MNSDTYDSLLCLLEGRRKRKILHSEDRSLESSGWPQRLLWLTLPQVSNFLLTSLFRPRGITWGGFTLVSGILKGVEAFGNSLLVPPPLLLLPWNQVSGHPPSSWSSFAESPSAPAPFHQQISWHLRQKSCYLRHPVRASLFQDKDRNTTHMKPNATQSIQKLSYHLSHFLFCADDPLVPLAGRSSMLSISASRKCVSKHSVNIHIFASFCFNRLRISIEAQAGRLRP